MTLLLAVYLAFGLCHLAVACHAALRSKRPTRPARPFSGTVGVILPVRGDSPTLRATLSGLATQQGLDYRLVVVTESATDGAVPTIREAALLFPRIQHVVAGLARGSAQKNHSLLAGMRALTGDEIHVTVDADVLPPSDWLHRLVAPFADPNVSITTTHHLPNVASRRWADLTAATMIRYWGAVAALPFLTALWGGGTAFRARSFESLGLGRLWQECVVDDVIAGSWAARHGLRRVFCSDALVPTAGPPWNWKGLYAWTLRQVQFVRHCDPLMWVAGLLLTVPTGLMLSALPLGALLAVHSVVSPAFPVGAALTGLLVLASGAVLQRLGPEPRASAWRHGVALVLTAFLLSVAVLRAGWGRTLTWGQRRYHLRSGGRVGAIEWVAEAPTGGAPIAVPLRPQQVAAPEFVFVRRP